MAKFWQKKYISKYTGAEIDAAVAKAGDATKVTANPTLAGTESALEGLQVGNTKYKVGGDRLFDDSFTAIITANSATVFVLSIEKTVDSEEARDHFYQEMSEAFLQGKDLILATISNSAVPSIDAGDKIGILLNNYSVFSNVPEVTTASLVFMGKNYISTRSYTSGKIYFMFQISLT